MPKNSTTGGTNTTTKADADGVVNLVMSVANTLRTHGYQSSEYKDVIIPMVIIRRIECALAPTRDAVLRAIAIDKYCSPTELCEISGFPFYNKTGISLENLRNDSPNLVTRFKKYIANFSKEVADILKSLNFLGQIDKMNDPKHRCLLAVVQKFYEVDLSPERVRTQWMGYIFEELIRKFSENAEAGDHYTGRDIIKLMVDILLAEGCEDMNEDGKIITVLDQACGTGGMLSTSFDAIRDRYENATVYLFGQELVPASYAMCLAEMLIKGQDPRYIKNADTLMEDCFKGRKMRFVLENPPFGTSWGGNKKEESERAREVKKEHAKGMGGRWGAGLPKTDDSQMLFLQSAIDKMDDKVGRCAIIHNSSPLFSGGTTSGESKIRFWLLENDLIEAIIALPTDLFYNTGLATYIWVLSKNKRPERKGWIQLIDASSYCRKLPKSLGHKRNEISETDRKEITKLYKNFARGLDAEKCKTYKNEEFAYFECTVLRPLRRRYEITEESIVAMCSNGSIADLYDEKKASELEELAMEDSTALNDKQKKTLEKYRKNKSLYEDIVKILRGSVSDNKYFSMHDFEPVIAGILASLLISDKKLIEKIAHGLSAIDPAAPIQKDKKGEIIYEDEIKDSEFVKFEGAIEGYKDKKDPKLYDTEACKKTIEDYVEKEVRPYIQYAKCIYNGKKFKTGAEIPFTRYFYKYQQLSSSKDLEVKFLEKEKSVSESVAKLFKQG